MVVIATHWAEAVHDIVTRHVPDVERERQVGEFYRFTWRESQTQLFCLTDRSVVLIFLRRQRSNGAETWDPVGVEKKIVDEEAPASVAAAILRSIGAHRTQH